MFRSLPLVLVCFAVLVGLPLAAPAQPAMLVERGASELDAYTAQRDGAFAWRVARVYEGRPGMTGFAIDLTSQRWREAGEVSHPLWTHMVQVVVPEEVRHDTALLLIGGGRRQERAPNTLQEELWMIARQTGTIVAAVPNVPNQPLALPDRARALPDGRQELGPGRFEDDLLAESWVLAKATGDEGWIVHLAMVESVVAAMDAVQRFARSEQGGGNHVEGFVLAGGSKRGWTAWLTAAVDRRVRGIIPMVIDVLNLPATMRHHYGAYGFFAPAIGDYAGRNLMQELDSPEGLRLRRVVDPYLYRDRLAMPKFLLNAAGDQYFLPDTTRYYIDDLPGVTRLRVVPNMDHAIDRNPDAVLSAIGFYQALLRGIELPKIAVEAASVADGATQWTVRVSAAEPARAGRVALWSATNPKARDFRQEAIGRAWTMRELEPGGDGSYRVRIEEPASGYTAYFVEARFVVQGQLAPLVFTTPVGVIPDVLEHAFEAGR